MGLEVQSQHSVEMVLLMASSLSTVAHVQTCRPVNVQCPTTTAVGLPLHLPDGSIMRLEQSHSNGPPPGDQMTRVWDTVEAEKKGKRMHEDAGRNAVDPTSGPAQGP